MSWVRLQALSVPPLALDAGLALLLWSVGAAQLFNEQQRFMGGGRQSGGGGYGPLAGPDTLSYVLLGFAASFLVVRRRWPLLTLAGVTLFGSLFLVRGEPVFPVQLIVLVAVYTAVAESRLSRQASIALCLVAGAILGAALYINDDPISTASWAMHAAWIIAAIFLGDSVRSRREYALQAERSREEEARRRVADERLQIARELHDVVGHNIALINVQAGAGSHVLYKDAEQAKETFDNIRAASHETLQELRSLVGVLREPLSGEPMTPTVGLDGLERLVESMIEAGQRVKLTVLGKKRQLSGIVDLSAYRILQEALTNTVRHAPSAEVSVSVNFQPDAVALDVTNGPGDDGRARMPGGGHGLLGMRERVLAIGGQLDAGPSPDGGFHVRAVLPLEGPST